MSAAVHTVGINWQAVGAIAGVVSIGGAVGLSVMRSMIGGVFDSKIIPLVEGIAKLDTRVSHLEGIEQGRQQERQLQDRISRETG